MKKKDLKNKSTRELKALFRELYDVVYVSECFGVNDLVLMDWVEEELYSRGIEVDTENKLIFIKNG